MAGFDDAPRSGRARTQGLVGAVEEGSAGVAEGHVIEPATQMTPSRPGWSGDRAAQSPSALRLQELQPVAERVRRVEAVVPRELPIPGHLDSGR